MSAQLSFFDDLFAEVPTGRTFARGGDGAARLLRALVRGGLAQDAWPIAAAMALLLDAEAGESR
jgi:hypothetical protein